MPNLNIPIGPQGPVVDVYVGVSSARQRALQDNGQPVPNLQRVRLLIDTGASRTTICDSVMSQFAMQPTGQVPVSTPSTGATPVYMSLYDVNLYFLFQGGAVPPPMHMVDTVPVIATDFQAQGIQGLVGRDILARGSLIYHGDINLCTLTF
ncbi:hypothetical protein AB9H29_14455 [Stenotrophomonas sepilia]|uniref:hypothetical protein n=1 Tax=Stenotrophomonas sepilia TaxID=2860290 RepID=UPI0035578914